MGIEEFFNKRFSRRDFLKAGAVVGAELTLPNLDFLKNNLENQEGLDIIKREDWDTAWNAEEGKYDGIKARYEKPIGSKYYINILDKKREHYVTTFRYLESKEKIYNRMIIHHTEMDEASLVGNDPIKQMEFLRDSQTKSTFGDIAYNFAITPDGQIFECTPTTYFSYHAGHTKESTDYLKEHKADIADIRNESDPKKKIEKIEHYINSKKMDPDYRSLGIVLLGNFDKNKPTEEQLKSLEKLMNSLKNEYHIPTKNIIRHSEVKQKVVEASGLNLYTDIEKTCPGKNFTSLEEIKTRLSEDSELAKKKTILLKNVLK